MGGSAQDERSVDNKAEGDVDRLVRDRFFRGIDTGVFIEVGAARPDYLSTGALFREDGWRVISIEPNPVYVEMHRRLGHEILAYACGDRDADDVDFQVVDSQGAEYLDGKVSFESFSSLSLKDEYKAYAKEFSHLKFQTIKVALRRLDSILARHAPEVTSIDALSIDVEGWELEVIAGLSLDRYRPRVMIIENLFKSKDYVRYMRRRGYLLWRRLHPNDIYVRAEALSAPERYALIARRLLQR